MNLKLDLTIYLTLNCALLMLHLRFVNFIIMYCKSHKLYAFWQRHYRYSSSSRTQHNAQPCPSRLGLGFVFLIVYTAQCIAWSFKARVGFCLPHRVHSTMHSLVLQGYRWVLSSSSRTQYNAQPCPSRLGLGFVFLIAYTVQCTALSFKVRVGFWLPHRVHSTMHSLVLQG